MDPSQQSAAVDHATAMMYTMIPLMIGFIVVANAIIVIPFWQIFKKSGLGAPLSLLMIIPLINLVMLYVLAFSRWKVIPTPEFGYGAAGYTPVAPYAPGASYTPASYAPIAGPVTPGSDYAGAAQQPPSPPPTI